MEGPLRLLLHQFLESRAKSPPGRRYSPTARPWGPHRKNGSGTMSNEGLWCRRHALRFQDESQSQSKAATDSRTAPQAGRL